MTTDELALCRAHPLLSSVSASDLEVLLDGCEILAVPAGEVLLETGAKNAQIFFLLQGTLRVLLNAQDDGHAITLDAGEIVGEMSVIEDKPVGAQVVAGEACTVLVMPETVYWRGYCTRPELIRPLLRSLISRMRKTNSSLREAFERQVRFEMIQRELESAAKIQASMFPTTLQLVETPRLTIHPYFQPARMVGGDFYDVFRMGSGRVAFAVGDVSGKGMPAALFMIRVVTALRMILARDPAPEEILPELNRQLCATNEELMFVTMALVIVEVTTGSVIYLNAGHPPVIVGTESGFELWAPPNGMMLGINPNALFGSATRTLAPKNVIVLYSDGLTEAENEYRQQFGTKGALTALKRTGFGHGASHYTSQLRSTVNEFSPDDSKRDDTTILTLTWS